MRSWTVGLVLFSLVILGCKSQPEETSPEESPAENAAGEESAGADDVTAGAPEADAGSGTADADESEVAAAPDTASADVAAVVAVDDAEDWSGIVQVPGQPLPFFLSLKNGPDGATGVIDIPLQNVTAVPLDEVVFEGNKRRLAWTAVGAKWDFEIAADGATATGTMQQGGMELPLELTRGRVKRPQALSPPFPYAEEEVTFTSKTDASVLSGTLTLPEGSGPFPAAVLISGSGSQDRDESLMGHKPFLVLSDHLTRNGIAVLRFDDRGVGKSTAASVDVDTFDLSGDAEAGFELLLQRDDIDKSLIGFIGHSEGGVIAPIIASRRDDVGFLVLLAGTGVRGDLLLSEQLAAMYRAHGVPQEVIDPVLVIYGEAIPILLDPERSEADRKAAATRLVEAQGKVATEHLGKTVQLEGEVAAAMGMASSKWMRTFAKLDPAEYLKQVKAPILVLNGSLDTQVVASQNLPAIKAALEAGGNSTVVIEELAGLNHLFQTATTGSPEEYATIEETMSPVALRIMSGWIGELAAQ